MNTMIHQDGTPQGGTKAGGRGALLRLLVFAALGALCGFFGASLALDSIGRDVVEALTWSQASALTVGAIMLVSLLLIALGFTVPAVGMRMKLFEDRDQWEDERRLMLLSSIGCAAWMILLIALALAEPLGLNGSVPLLAGLGLLMLVLLYTCWRILSVYDELWHGLNSESCTYAFYIVFIVGGVWSAVAHLGFAAALAPLDWVTLLTVASIIGAILAAQKRGLLRY